MNIQDVLKTENTFAVVGATDNQEKYGYKVFVFLKRKNYNVFPINPNRETVQGEKAYPTLNDLGFVPDVVSVVTPPEISEKIVEEAVKLGVKNIWFQPGAENEKAVKMARDNNINTIFDECILIEGK